MCLLNADLEICYKLYCNIYNSNLKKYLQCCKLYCNIYKSNLKKYLQAIFFCIWPGSSSSMVEDQGRTELLSCLLDVVAFCRGTWESPTLVPFYTDGLLSDQPLRPRKQEM